jgi:hypothetical protein
MANYAIRVGIDKQRKLYINLSHTRYAMRSHKIGIKVPRTVEEALTMDMESNTTFWHEAIKKKGKTPW